jgi:protein-S-isoprenylcysteine O-methyltransferase Ste14
MNDGPHGGAGETPYDRPNRLPLPPMIFLGCLVAAYLIDWLLPIPIELPRELIRIKSAVMIGLGLMLMVWSSSTLNRARTTVLPHRASTALVTSGPFAVSRNPIYIGNTLILAGFAGIANSAWYYLAAAVALFLVDRLAVRPEEAHLAARFPEEWAAYVARVRRWL